VDKEIEEIQRQLHKKLAEREVLIKEKDIHEQEIDKSRAKYRDVITKLEKEIEKVLKEEDKNIREAEEQKLEQADLLDYEDTFKSRL
jgi:hypothetical protein